MEPTGRKTLVKGRNGRLACVLVLGGGSWRYNWFPGHSKLFIIRSDQIGQLNLTSIKRMKTRRLWPPLGGLWPPLGGHPDPLSPGTKGKPDDLMK